jgi:hypothetical protein
MWCCKYHISICQISEDDLENFLDRSSWYAVLSNIEQETCNIRVGGINGVLGGNRELSTIVALKKECPCQSHQT